LFQDVVSVGLNGGEPTLRKDLADLVQALFDSLPKLKYISLITNAYRSEEVIARIREVGEVVARHQGHLDVMVSLDGYGDVHDRVRGKPGNFERAQKVIAYARQDRNVANLRIGCTIIRENVYGLADLFEYCQRNDLYVKYRLGIPHQRLYTKTLQTPYALSKAETYHVVEFLEGLLAHYEKLPTQRNFYRSLINQLAHGEPRSAGCDWKHRGATVTSKGELLFCAVESKVLCDVRDERSEEAFFAGQAHLSEIVQTKCATCHHDYVGLPDRKTYARQLVKRVSQKTGLIGAARSVYHTTGADKLRHRLAYDRRLKDLDALAMSAVPMPPGEARDRSRLARQQVLICGWYGTETLGDKAILGGIIQVLKACMPGCEIAVASLQPYVSEQTAMQMPELAGAAILPIHEAVRHARTVDFMLFGGGPMMAINELADMEAMFKAAGRALKIVAGCGVGPMGDAHLNEAIARILSLSDVNIYRDERSLQAATRMGIDPAHSHVCEDPAFTWLQSQADSGAAPSADARPTLLLGLRDFPYEQYARDYSESKALKIKRSFEAGVISFLHTVVQAQGEVRILPLPMCTNHFGDDDRWFYRALFRAHPELHKHMDLSYLERELAPQAYVQAFKSADFALTMRYHSLVFALGLGVPCLALDYTMGKGKVDALAKSADVPVYPLDGFDPARAAEVVLPFLKRPGQRKPGKPPSFPQVLTQAIQSHLHASHEHPERQYV
jgi:polysaccharide pyruvyl transferase WcaK-like protein/MoaA/NifB/PqqE/SkfB family radical SAM enzyme